MKHTRIKLTQGKFTLIDSEDIRLVLEHRWHAHKMTYRFYASTNIEGKTVQLHRFILNPPKGKVVHHINGDTLDNRKQNLEVCSCRENLQAFQRKRTGTTSRYRGVWFSKKEQRWVSQLRAGKIRVYIGRFKNEKDAAKAYNNAAKKHFGKYAQQFN